MKNVCGPIGASFEEVNVRGTVATPYEGIRSLKLLIIELSFCVKSKFKYFD